MLPLILRISITAASSAPACVAEVGDRTLSVESDCATRSREREEQWLLTTSGSAEKSDQISKRAKRHPIPVAFENGFGLVRLIDCEQTGSNRQYIDAGRVQQTPQSDPCLGLSEKNTLLVARNKPSADFGQGEAGGLTGAENLGKIGEQVKFVWADDRFFVEKTATNCLLDQDNLFGQDDLRDHFIRHHESEAKEFAQKS